MKTFKEALELFRRSANIWIGTGKSVRLQRADDGGVEFFITSGDPSVKSFLNTAYGGFGISAIQDCFLNGRLMLEGPKIFRPSAEQCAVLERIEPRFSAGEHRQPYPTMVVEFPEAFRAEQTVMAIAPDGKAVQTRPSWITVHHDPSLPALVCSTLFENDFSIARTIHHYSGADATIAGVLGHSLQAAPGSLPYSDEEHAVSIACTKVAINALTLLCHYGHRLTPENPNHYARLERYLKVAQKRGDDTKERQELAHALQVCDFEHEVVLYDRQSVSRHEGEPTGRVVRAHWRSGHMRHQPCGEGRRERKLIFIKPVLIHAEEGAAPALTSYRMSKRGDSDGRMAKSLA